MLYGSERSFEINCRIAGRNGDSFSVPYDTYRRLGHGFLGGSAGSAVAEGLMPLIRAFVCCAADISFYSPTSDPAQRCLALTDTGSCSVLRQRRFE
jgi:hypothetical protein